MNSTPDVRIYEDVAREMGISDPSLVEKDFFAVRALSVCADSGSDLFIFVFAGGTSLSKIFRPTGRMSEDVDVKIFLTEKAKELSGNQLRKSLGEMKNLISDRLKTVNLPVTKDCIVSYDGNRSIKFKIPYVQGFQSSSALRPEIKLDLFLATPFSPPVEKPVYSFVSDISGKPPEIPAIRCVDIETTSAEKIVLLTRRVAASLYGIKTSDEGVLIRHVYDLHVVAPYLEYSSSFSEIVNRVMKYDTHKYKNKNPEYYNDPISEITKALLSLANDSVHSRNYAKFLDPLVYAKNPPAWREALDSVFKIAKKVWGISVTQ